jgi:hypothetical protein
MIRWGQRHEHGHHQRGHHRDRPRQAAPLASSPDLASLTLGSMNLATGPSVNAPEAIAGLAARIQAAGAVPELEAFEAGFNLILGALGAAPLDLLGLGHMVALLPQERSGRSAAWASTSSMPT